MTDGVKEVWTKVKEAWERCYQAVGGHANIRINNTRPSKRLLDMNGAKLAAPTSEEPLRYFPFPRVAHNPSLIGQLDT